MFAPKVAKPLPNPTAGSTRRLADPRATLAGRERGRDHSQDVGAENSAVRGAPLGVSRDFSKIS
jgi:hypothetical protein